jgi:hypothetical protein
MIKEPNLCQQPWRLGAIPRCCSIWAGIVGKARYLPTDFAADSIDAPHRWRSEQGRLIVALVPIGSGAPRARTLAPAATVKSMPAQQHRGPAGQI